MYGVLLPSSPLFMKPITMMPRAQGLGLVGPRALGHCAWLCVLLGLWTRPKQALTLIQSPKTVIKPLWGDRQRWDLAWLGNAIFQEGESLDAWYYLEEDRCWTSLLGWELVPRPLLPFPTKQPLRDNGIGPSLALIEGSNHNASTYLKL